MDIKYYLVGQGYDDTAKKKSPNLGEETGVLKTKIQKIMERKAGKILKIKDRGLEVASQHIECYEWLPENNGEDWI